MQTIWQDLRYALRQLRNGPVFALTAVLSLGLGMGATIGVYTLVDAIVLRPLPYGAPAQLYALEPAMRDGNVTWMPYANLKAIADRSQGKLSTGGVLAQWAAKIDTGSQASPVNIVETTANLPTLLGVQPALGRSFAADAELPGRNRVLLLSDAVWRRDFAADPLIAGKIVKLSGTVYTVLGVMPRNFTLPMDTENEVWAPRAIAPGQQHAFDDDNGLAVTSGILRASQGMTAQQVSSLVNNIQGQLANEHRDLHNLATQMTATPYLFSLNHIVTRPLLLLLGVGLSFWLLASLNVVSLLIARATVREREFAVRSALGATRSRLLGQSIVESLVLSTAGSLLGLLLASSAIKLLWRPITHSLPLTQRVHISPQVVIALAALALITGMLVGMLPALKASGRRVQNGLRGGAAPLPRAEQHRLRSGLVAAQLTITVVLLAGAGLFLRTVTALRSVPLGFSAQNVLTGGILQPAGVPIIFQRGEPGIVQRYYMPLLDRLKQMPGVEAATLSSVLPMRSEFQATMAGKLDGKDTGVSYPTQARIASPGLPETFGIPVLRGRFFTADDTAGSPRVAVVNEAFVKAYLQNTDPLDHTFGMDSKPASAMRIVGVLQDVKQGDVTAPAAPEIYVCLAQTGPGDPFYGLVNAFMEVGIRASIPAELLRKQFEVALNHVDPDAQSINVKTVHEAVEDSFGSQTLMAHLLEGFSLMALLIALVGLYGTVAFTVAQRTREFGVRLALGASQESITRLVMDKAMRPVIVGLIAGNVALWFVARFVRSYLYGVTPHNAPTLAVASLTLAATGLVAALLPARRAASTDPMRALRTE